MSAWRYCTIVFLCGAVIMALEILSSRLLAPQFGNSVYVWGSIISVFLAALSAGYWIGGRLADRAPRLELLSKLILLAAVTESVLLLFGRALVDRLGDATGGSAWGTLVVTSLLFGPPSVLLATVSPFTVRLATRDLGELGNTAGRLYAISTAGSLVGTLGCTFALIPLFDLDRNLSLLVQLTVVSALLGLLPTWRQQKPALVLAAGVILFASSGIGSLARRDPGLLASFVTPYQTLAVIEAVEARYLQADQVVQSGIHLSNGDPAVEWPRFTPAALLMKPDLRRILVLGMGSGSVATYLGNRLEEVEFDMVEVDRVVTELAAEYFGFEAGPRKRVHVDDARRFLSARDETWDFIFSDTYIGSAIPFHLTTVEFFSLVKERLEPDGVVAMNVASDFALPFPLAIYRTVAEVFPRVEVFAVPPANTMFLATNGTGPPWSEVGALAAKLDETLRFDPTLSEIVHYRRAIGIDLTDVLLLEDQYAPVNWMVRLAEAPNLLPAATPDG